MTTTFRKASGGLHVGTVMPHYGIFKPGVSRAREFCFFFFFSGIDLKLLYYGGDISIMPARAHSGV